MEQSARDWFDLRAIIARPGALHQAASHVEEILQRDRDLKRKIGGVTDVGRHRGGAANVLKPLHPLIGAALSRRLWTAVRHSAWRNQAGHGGILCGNMAGHARGRVQVCRAVEASIPAEVLRRDLPVGKTSA